MIVVKETNVVGQKQQFFSVLSKQVTATIRVDLAGGAEKLLASDACRRCRQVLPSCWFQTRKLAGVPVRVECAVHEASCLV